MADPLSQDADVLSFQPGSPMLAPPPPAPAMAPQPVASGGAAAPAPPPGPNFQQQFQEAQASGDAAMAGVKKAGEAEIAAKEAAAREREPLRQRALAEAQQPIPQPPKSQQPPATPKRNDTHDDETWLFASSLLGSLAGAFTRRHVTNALAAFTGAMEGYQEGSKQKLEQNMKIWEAENKKIQETNKQAMDEYQAILENRKFSETQKSVALQLAGQKYDDKAAIEVAKMQNSLVQAQYFDKRAQAAEQMQKSADALAERRDARNARNKALEQQQMEESAREYMHSAEGQERIRSTMALERAPPSSGAPRNTPLGLRESMIADELSARGYDATKYAAKLAGERVSGATEARKGQRAEIAFAVGPEARNVRSLNVAIAHLDTLDNLSRALGASDFPRLNQLSNRIETELGYAMPKSFDAAKQIVSAEIIKAIVANGGGVNERKEAADNLDKAGSYEQLSQVIGTYKSLLGGQMKGLQKQYEHNTGRKDFYDMLEPETIRALEGAGIAPTPTRTPPGYGRTGDKSTPFAKAVTPPPGFPPLPPGWTFESMTPADRS
jgi:hypothetical protein